MDTGKRETGQNGGRDASTKATTARARSVLTPRARGTGGAGNGASGNIGSSDSGRSTPTEEAAPATGEQTAKTVRIVDAEYDAPPPPKAEKEKTPPKKNTVPVNTRRQAAENVVRDAIDLGNMAAVMTVGPLPPEHPMAAFLPVTLTGTPESMRVERTEYERLLTHGSNVLSRFDFVTKLQTTSDLGSIAAVLVAWGMRLYMLWMIKHPDQTPNLANIIPFRRKQPAQPQQEPPTGYDNGRPPDIDLAAMAAFNLNPTEE